MNIGRLTKQLIIDEGSRPRVYSDNGVYKVGVGHVVQSSSFSEIKPLKVGDKINKEKEDELLKHDLLEATKTCILVFDEVWLAIPEEAKEVLINISFNTKSAFLSLKIFIYYCYEQEWVQASQELLKTEWAKNNIGRATRLSRRLEAL